MRAPYSPTPEGKSPVTPVNDVQLSPTSEFCLQPRTRFQFTVNLTGNHMAHHACSSTLVVRANGHFCGTLYDEIEFEV